MSFKRTAREWRAALELMVQVPYDFVRRQIAVGDYQTSFVSRLITQKLDGSATPPPNETDENDIKWAAAVMYLAGVDPVSITLKGFFLAMILFPEVQIEAQTEIDRVIGHGRLPMFQDRQNLPYVHAIVSEVFGGFFTILPSTKTHSVSTLSVTSIKEMNQNLGLMLSALDEELAPAAKAVDEHGIETDVQVKRSSGTLSFFEDFPYNIIPRTPEKAALIRTITRH
ncbi:hypothetical protein NLG97_g327 [Lecanicillium saksenae]|uniref:Uncharacterized protein n=1 Tax=Lecanicillium saksenae TaxID=468837 RepID=A0ACC1RAB5_9HYPO|nr:hypothetical protein NLG97_g327 [Lecanicillium saksenae]